MMCAGSSEPSLVANSISTQISYAGSNFACACRNCIIVGKREKKRYFFLYIFILFYTSVTFYASIFCDSGPYMHCRLCDSFFHLFLPTLVKMGSSNPPLLFVKRVGSRSGSTFCRSWVQYFCKWYQLATLHCITFCRCFKVSGTLRLLVRDSTPAEALCCVLGQDRLSAA